MVVIGTSFTTAAFTGGREQCGGEADLTMRVSSLFSSQHLPPGYRDQESILRVINNNIVPGAATLAVTVDFVVVCQSARGFLCLPSSVDRVSTTDLRYLKDDDDTIVALTCMYHFCVLYSSRKSSVCMLYKVHCVPVCLYEHSCS